MARVRGELEAQVTRLLWAADGPRPARELWAGFGPDAPAVTTLLTVLDRLRRKGAGDPVRCAHQRHLRAAQSESDRAVTTMLQSLRATGDRGAVLLRFAGDLDRTDADVLHRALDRR